MREISKTGTTSHLGSIQYQESESLDGGNSHLLTTSLLGLRNLFLQKGFPLSGLCGFPRSKWLLPFLIGISACFISYLVHAFYVHTVIASTHSFQSFAEKFDSIISSPILIPHILLVNSKLETKVYTNTCVNKLRESCRFICTLQKKLRCTKQRKSICLSKMNDDHILL